jgi:hypothetical protein
MEGLGVAQLQKIAVEFKPDATLEFAVTYAHGDLDEPPNPGTKKRTTNAARMAAYGLQRALEGLDKGAPIWGGFATNTRTSRDLIMVDRKEHAA